MDDNHFLIPDQQDNIQDEINTPLHSNNVGLFFNQFLDNQVRNVNNINSNNLKNDIESNNKKSISLFRENLVILNKHADIIENEVKEEITNPNNKSINTLPGALIKIMSFKNRPMAENELLEHVSTILNDLRKPDGSKYKTNIKKVLTSTLSSSGIFEKIDKDKKLWYFKIDESLHYLDRNKTLERFSNITNDITKTIVKNDNIEIFKENDNILYLSEQPENKLLNKKTNKPILKKSLKDYKLKYVNATNILDDLLDKYKNSNNPQVYKNFRNPFYNCKNWQDLIKKTKGDSNILKGMLSVYKYFKPLINKKLKGPKAKKEHNKEDVEKKTNFMSQVTDKIQEIKKMFTNLNNK